MMRLPAVLIAKACIVALACGIGLGFGSHGSGDFQINFTVTDDPNNYGVASAAGLTLGGSMTLTPAETTLIHLAVGDSITANYSETAYTRINNKNEAFNIYNGLSYRWQDPVVSSGDCIPAVVACPGGSWTGRLADKLITAGKFARVITADVALNGSMSKDFAKSGAYNNRARVACLYARKYGWPITGSDGNWRMMISYSLGTNDASNSISQAVYTANALSFIQLMADYGCTPHIFIPQTITTLLGSYTPIQTAQAALLSGPANIYAGPNKDDITGGFLQDAVHFNAAGSDLFAGRWNTLIQAHY